MPYLEAVLTYSRDSMGRDSTSVPLARTSDPDLLKVLRDRLIAEAMEEVALWRSADPVIGEMAAAELARLERLFDVLLPTDPETGLHLVEDRDR